VRRDPGNGAPTAAAIVADLAEGGRPDVAERRRGWRYRPVFYAWMLARVPPHRLLRLGFQPPRAVCLALGVPAAELLPAVDRVVAEAGGRPELLLVVTDADDLAPLRRLGVGIEYLPPRNEVESNFPDRDSGAWLRRRLAGILEGRSPRTVIGIGPENEALSATLSARDGTRHPNAPDRSG
jgi:hypothetical protein